MNAKEKAIEYLKDAESMEGEDLRPYIKKAIDIAIAETRKEVPNIMVCEKCGTRLTERNTQIECDKRVHRTYINAKKEVFDDIESSWANEYGNDNIDTKSYDVFYRIINKLKARHLKVKK